MTKRDLSELCLEGLLESTEQQQQTQLAALLQVSLDCVIEGVFCLKNCLALPGFLIQQVPPCCHASSYDASSMVNV